MEFNSNLLKITQCRDCEISNRRNNIVNGVGNKDSELMFIGEAPGYKEDIAGTPFVGDSGKMLDIMLDLIDIPREECFITNVIKCRPPNNRNPIQQEIANCTMALVSELAFTKPKIVVLLGATALQSYFRNNKLKITTLRGKVFTQTIRDEKRYVIATYHPSYVIRNGQSIAKDYVKDFRKIAILYKYLVDPLIQPRI